MEINDFMIFCIPNASIWRGSLNTWLCRVTISPPIDNRYLTLNAHALKGSLEDDQLMVFFNSSVMPFSPTPSHAHRR